MATRDGGSSRRLRRSVPLLVLTVALAACSTPDPPPGTLPTVAPPAATTQPPTTTPTWSPGDPGPVTDEQFVTWVRGNTFGAESLTDEMILTTAKATCVDLDDGRSYMSIVLEISDSDVDDAVKPGLLGVTGAAIPAFCPHHTEGGE